LIKIFRYPGGELDCGGAGRVDQYCVLIPHAAHHLDFYGTDAANDPVEVTKARIEMGKVISRFENCLNFYVADYCFLET